MNYNHNNYITNYDGIACIDALEIRIEEIKKTLRLVSDLNKWDHRYQPEKWTIKEVVQHCIDCERIFSARAVKIARKESQSLLTFDQDLYVENLNTEEINPDILIKEWLHLMNATMFQFQNYSQEILNRTGLIGDTNYAVKHLGYIMAGHSIHHINVIKERYL